MWVNKSYESLHNWEFNRNNAINIFHVGIMTTPNLHWYAHGFVLSHNLQQTRYIAAINGTIILVSYFQIKQLNYVNFFKQHKDCCVSMQTVSPVTEASFVLYYRLCFVNTGFWTLLRDTWNQGPHWGRVTHICVSKLTIIGSDNGLSPRRRQAIIWSNAGILLIGTLGTNLSEILSKIHSFSFKKMHLKMSSAKGRLFTLGHNELTHCPCETWK